MHLQKYWLPAFAALIEQRVVCGINHIIKMSLKGKTVAILHPDLGIGGAEQLILNVALALKAEGALLRMYTPRFDEDRCFAECKEIEIEV